MFTQTRMSWDPKRLAIAGSAILVTCGLAFFAVAVAQRDARDRLEVNDSVEPAYALQSPSPIQVPLDQDNLSHSNPFDRPTAAPKESFSASRSRIEEMDDQHPRANNFESPRDLSESSRRKEVSAFAPPPNLNIADDKAFAGELSQSVAVLDGNNSEEAYVDESNVDAGPLEAEEAIELESSLPSEVQLASGFQAPPGASSNTSGLAPVPGASPFPDSLPASPNRLAPPPSLSGNDQNVDGGPKLLPPALRNAPADSQNLATANAGLIPGASPIGNADGFSSPAQNLPSAGIPAFPSESAPIAAPSPSNSRAAPPSASLQSPQNTPPNLQSGSQFPSSRPGLPSPPTFASQSDPNRNSGLAPRDGMMERNGWANEPMNRRSSVNLASGAPGVRQLDGAQNPSLQIQKRAPQEVQVGQPATFSLLVRNVGNATAFEVVVTDSVPKGTRLARTAPEAEVRNDGTLVWSLGELPAGAEQVLTVELIPETEGEIGSVASVNFAAQASVRTVSTQPKLQLRQQTENKVLMGQVLRIQITVTNEGTGIARGVSLEEDVPASLKHPMGTSLGVPIGDLAPGQSRTTNLELTAVEAGKVQNLIRAVASNAPPATSTADVEIVAPQLRLAMAGPRLRYLERQATYQVSLTNTGSSIARDIEILAYLPRGLQFNSAGNHGEYISSQHAVSWGLEELAVGATATTELTLLPVEEGDIAIRIQSQADGVRAEPIEKQVRVEGQSELAFTIEDDNDPIETDGETTYTIKVVNSGTRIDHDVAVMIELPPGSRITQVNAPTAYKLTQSGILFDPIPQMAAKDSHLFRFTAQLQQEGVQVVRAFVKSKLRPVAVVKEESTQVYLDR